MGLPCNPPPWGVLTALESRKILWRALARHIGTPTFGGPLATASGLVFIGAALDDYLRAFDAKTGAELWTGRLPSAGIATPTSYLWQGRQYVVIGAGGHGEAGAPAGDTLVAFALPRPGEPGPSPWRMARPAGRALQAACRDGGSRRGRAGGAVAVAAAKASPAAGLSSRGEPASRRRLSRWPVRLTTSHCAGRNFLLSAMARPIAPPMADGHGRANSDQVRFGR
jgi:hypothetical protein